MMSKDKKEVFLFPGFSGQQDTPEPLEELVDYRQQNNGSDFIITISTKVDSKEKAPEKDEEAINESEHEESKVWVSDIEEINQRLSTFNSEAKSIQSRVGEKAMDYYYGANYLISASKFRKKMGMGLDKIRRNRKSVAFGGVFVLAFAGCSLVLQANESENEQTQSKSNEDFIDNGNSTASVIDEVSINFEISSQENNVIEATNTKPTTTTSTTTSSTATTTSVKPEEVFVESQVPPETTIPVSVTEPVVTIDNYQGLDCNSNSGVAVVQSGWSFSEIAGRCGLSVPNLQQYNPQITDINKIIVGTKINLIPNNSYYEQTSGYSSKSSSIDCAGILGETTNLPYGFTLESYLDNSLGYSTNNALYLAYGTMLAKDYGLSGELIAGNKYCLPTVNGISIRYGVDG